MLDDSTAQAGKWDPGQTTNDAHTAINDSSTIGYLGEFNSGASAISIPLLNQAGDRADQPREHGRRADVERAWILAG